MPAKLVSIIETTTPTKTLLPWTVIARHGRQSVESQFFALLGYPESELQKLTPAALEESKDLLELALRLLTTFEYIPKDENEVESFFEKKLVQFETRLREGCPEIPTLHTALGILQGTKVLFATAGDLIALQITPASIVNLAETATRGPFHFETFRAGTLTPRAYLLFTPKQMGTLLKSDELKTIASAPTSERKLNYLSELWEKRTALPHTFRAILLEAKPRAYKTPETTAVSIAHLLNTEVKTEELLSPPLFRPMVERLRTQGVKLYTRLTSALKTLASKEKLAGEGRTPLPAEPPRPPARTISSYFRQAGSWGTAQLKFPPVKPRVQGLVSQLTSEKIINRFNALPRRSKVLFILVAMFLFVFTQSVLLALRRNNLNKAEMAIRGEITAIRTLIDSANAASIYNDEAKAASELQEARRRIAALPEFQARTAAQFSISTLRSLKSYLTKAAQEELNTSLVPIQEKLAHLVMVNPATVAETVSQSLALEDKPQSRLLYFRRLYTLEKDKNQIYRHEPTANGFAEGKPWIQDGTEVRNTTTLTIDGSLYLDDGSGNIVQLLRGKKTAFALKPVDPPLMSVKKIWTNESSDYLYVLDQQERRLLAFAKKDGLLKAQYQSPAFTELKDFKIDEGKKLAYLLDGTSTISIPLSHL